MLGALALGLESGKAVGPLVGAVIAAAVGVLVRSSVVPLTNARAQIRAAKVIADHMATLPKPDVLPKPSGRKRGLIASWPDHRDLAAERFVSGTAPKRLNLATHLKLDILGNDRIGDCFWAAILHGMQCAYTAAGQEFTPTLDMAVAGYKTTGYDPSKTDAEGNNPTDRGTEPRSGLKSAVALGWIRAFVSVGLTDVAIRQAIAAYRGAVVLCWALPADVPEDGDWSKVSGPRAEGHATQPYGYSATRISNDTWAERGWFTPPFAGAYLAAAWAFTLPDPSVQPLIDHDKLHAAVAAL